MKCNHCGAEVNAGATFCGNCGQPMTPTQGPAQPVATYNPAGVAVPSPTLPKNTKATLAMVFGILGLVGWLIPILGCALAIAAIVLGTTSMKQPHKSFAVAGIILAIPVLGLSIFAWVKNAETIMENQKAKTAQQSNAPGVISSSLDTPCYSANFGEDFKIVQSSGSCTAKASNSSSTDIYNFKAIASNKKAEELEQVSQKDMDNVLGLFAGSKITNKTASTFAGSPAYVYNFSISSLGTIGTAIYIRRESLDSINTFIVVRETTGSDSSLNNLESTWQWKE
jgi:hypothetical protein